MNGMHPSMFPVDGKGPRLLSGFDLDANRLLLPEHVRALPKKQLAAFMDEHGIVPVPKDAQDNRFVSGGWFGQHAMNKAGKLLRVPERLASVGLLRAMGLTPQVSGAAYSMFEMMQPFIDDDAPAVTAAAETILSQATVMTLPANFFSFQGRTLWFHGMGKESNVVTTPGTLTFRARYGSGVVGDTALVASGAIVPDPVAVTDNLWIIDLWFKALARGPLTTDLTLLCHGIVQLANSDASLASDKAKYLPAGGTSLANVTGLDGTIAKTITITVTPTVATGSITLRDGWLVAMN